MLKEEVNSFIGDPDASTMSSENNEAPAQPLEQPPPASNAHMLTTTVQLKLPPYWPSDPQLWFAQVEAQFNTRRITSQATRFDYVIASLAPEVAHEVRDLLLKPPTAHQYDTLKDALIQRTTLSEQRRLQQLFSTEELGDRKPSQLLRRMQQLLGDNVISTDSSFMRELFLQRLPSHVRMVLASQSDITDITKLAQLADKIVEVAAPQINSTRAITTSTTPEIQQLRSEIADLKRIVQAMGKTQIRHRSSSRPSRSPHRSTRPVSPAPAENNSTDDLCWYHHRYGEDARKCQSPCSKSPENCQASH